MTFDYFSWWKYAVNELKISPSEAWKLDYIELKLLTNQDDKSIQDTSFMVNAQRKLNGMGEDELKNGY